ncbi:helix-turn-helix domain-containing protein [Pseudomonas chlororaphis]|uniref:helix-turn-helix domain-containing protein n=1 Tax=Pseudomonas chlororaphis TaxID=587753 RepID=UPI000F5609A7
MKGLWGTAGETKIELTQEEIGYLPCVTRQKINIAIRRMHAQGLVTLSYGRVKVTDVDGLHYLRVRNCELMGCE